MSDEHIKVLREQSGKNPVTTVNGRVYVTVDKAALDAAIAALNESLAAATGCGEG